MARTMAGICVVLLLFVAGCKARLNMQKTVQLSGGPQTFIIDAISSEQVVKVFVEAEAAPVDVFVFLEKNKTAAEAAFFNTKNDGPFLGRKMNRQSVELDVTVPANETAHVMVQPAGLKDPKDVKIKITN